MIAKQVAGSLHRLVRHFSIEELSVKDSVVVIGEMFLERSATER